MIKKVFLSLLSMVAILTWWTIRGDKTHTELVQSIPAKVWEGGGGTITVAVDASTAGKMSIEFGERKDNGRSLDAVEQIGPGSHSFSVEVPHNAGGYIEFEAVTPKPVDKMSWTIAYDGRRIARDSMTMEQPLKENEAFFLQQYYSDYSRPGVVEDDADDSDSDD